MIEYKNKLLIFMFSVSKEMLICLVLFNAEKKNCWKMFFNKN